MSSVVEQIKARLTVQDVLGTYLKLENAGQNLKTKCPFHAENTASFFVSPARNSYYCFGCNKGGDIFTFVQDIEGLDFRQALTLLADRAGVVLDTFNSTTTDPQKVLREIMEAASLFYIRELKEDDEAMQYLIKRGLTSETIAHFRIGYAPDSWKKSLDYLLARGYRAADINAVGLSVQGKSGTLYDRFRQRIMFPIANTVGQTIAFTGRIFETGRPSVTVRDMAGLGKYVNSPQTVLYNKSTILYAYDKAKVAIRKADACILVEGQVDTIMSHQAGLINTVAVSGTALTNDHLLLIKRLTNNLIMAFDADAAGIKSSRRALEMALGLGMDVRVAAITRGKDPADMIQENPEAWRQAVKKNVHVIEYYLGIISKNVTKARELRLAVEHEIIPLIARVKSHIDRAHFVSLIAERISLNESVIWDSVRAAPSPDNTDMIYTTNIEPAKSREDVIIDKLLAILFWQEGRSAASTMDTATMRANIQAVLGEQFAMHHDARTGHREQLIFEAELHYQGTQDLANEVDGLLRSLEQELLKKRLQIIIRDLKKKGAAQADTEALLKECQMIAARLESLKKIANKV